MTAVSRRPTIGEVARLAGVSPATVSRVLHDGAYIRPTTAAAVRAAIEELDYRPSAVARSLRTQATRTIGLIVPDLTDQFFAELVEGADAAARALGYSIVLGASASEGSRTMHYLHLMVDHRVDGLIIAAAELPAESRQWLRDIPVPVVAVNAETGDFAETSITSDNDGGARLQARHLLDLGHRRIGYLRGPRDLTAAAAREGGFMAVCEEEGVDRSAVTVVTPELSMTGGEEAVAELLRRDPGITGIATYSDQLAVGALRGLRAAGRRVPEDVSVVGFDGIGMGAWTSPALTTVAQQKHEMGRLAVANVVRALGAGEGEHAVEHLRLPMSLVVRESTAPPTTGIDAREAPAGAKETP